MLNLQTAEGEKALFAQHHSTSSSFFQPGLIGEERRQSASPTGINSFSVVAEAHHLSQIVYAIPLARVKAIFPRELQANGFEPIETILENHSCCWLSVTSYLDQQRGLLNSARAEAVEQTFYRLLLAREGQHFYWLLNTTIGSLSAVSGRNLWALPWHLGAMEFQLSYDTTNHYYHNYRLHSQSEFVNATWEIADTGKLASDEYRLSPMPLQQTINDCFIRRAGGIGLRPTRIHMLDANRGQVRQARCDLLERLGLLTQAELLNPAFVMLCRVASIEVAAPIILCAEETFALPRLKAA